MINQTDIDDMQEIKQIGKINQYGDYVYLEVDTGKEDMVLDMFKDMIDEDNEYQMDIDHPIRNTRIWRWFDTDVKPVMCDSDESFFAKMTSWLWHDLECPCCGFWRGAAISALTAYGSLALYWSLFK